MRLGRSSQRGQRRNRRVCSEGEEDWRVKERLAHSLGVEAEQIQDRGLG